MSEAAYWFVHQVQVQPRLGTKASQANYGTAVPVECWIEDEIKIVRDSEGAEVTSSATLFAPLADAGEFAPGSKVTTPARTAFVISVKMHDSGSLELDLDHVEIYLT